MNDLNKRYLNFFKFGDREIKQILRQQEDSKNFKKFKQQIRDGNRRWHIAEIDELLEGKNE